MQLNPEQEGAYKSTLETLDYLIEQVAALGPSNGHLRYATVQLKDLKRILKNWKDQ